MNTFATLAAVAAATLAVTSIAHADATAADTEDPNAAPAAETTAKPTTGTGTTFSLGASIGQTSQHTGGLVIILPEHTTTLTETHIRAAYHPDRVVELGMNLELGTGNGLSSTAVIADAKAYLLPMVPVSPTLTLGAGKINEHASSMSEESTWRLALVGGVGLEARIGRWNATLDLRLMAVRHDQKVPLGSSMETEFTHDGIFAASTQVGVSRTF